QVIQQPGEGGGQGHQQSATHTQKLPRADHDIADMEVDHPVVEEIDGAARLLHQYGIGAPDRPDDERTPQSLALDESELQKPYVKRAPQSQYHRADHEIAEVLHTRKKLPGEE